MGTILLALLVASLGIGFVVHAFRPSPGTSPPTPVAPLTSSSNGAIYYVIVRDGPYAPWFGSVEPDGTVKHIAFESTSDAHFHEISFSPDGARFAFADASHDASGIATAAADGTDVRHVTDGMNDSWPSWSPDGSKIAFSGTGSDPGTPRCGLRVDIDCPSDIYVMNADGSGIARLTTDPAPDFQPVWSPDGTRIAFVSGRGSTGTAIWVMNADGSDAHPVSAGVGGSDTWPSWSPDGSMIVFAAFRNGAAAIYGVAPDGSSEHVIKEADGIDTPAWSPDGSLIAYTALDPSSGSFALYTMRPDGSDASLVATDRPPGITADIAWRPVPRA